MSQPTLTLPSCGAAVAASLQVARGRLVIMGDATGSDECSRLAPFLDALSCGQPPAPGKRFAGGIEPGAIPPLHRYLVKPVFSFIGRLLFKSPEYGFHFGLAASVALALGPVPLGWFTLDVCSLSRAAAASCVGLQPVPA